MALGESALERMGAAPGGVPRPRVDSRVVEPSVTMKMRPERLPDSAWGRRGGRACRLWHRVGVSWAHPSFGALSDLRGPAAIWGCVLVLELPVSPCAARASQGGWVGARAAMDTADGAGRAAVAPGVI